MPLMNFVARNVPAISAVWLNKIDAFYTTLFGSATTASAAQIAIGVQTRTVRLIWQGGAVWKLFSADGVEQSLAASTTQGLQEAITLACTGIGTAGYDIEVVGGNLSTGGAAVLNCTTTVVWPPMQGKKIRFNAVTLNWGSGVGAIRAMTFNSMMMVDFALEGGQVVYQGSHALPILFKPSVGVPVDLVISIQQTKFYATVWGNTEFDWTGGGSCVLSSFDFNEINGNNAAVAFKVNEVPGGSNFGFNKFRLGHIHAVSGTAVMVGNAAPNAAQTFGYNEWYIIVGDDTVDPTNALQTYATKDTYRGTVDKSSLGAGKGLVVLGSSADENDIQLNFNAAPEWTDNSTKRSSWGFTGVDYPTPANNWAFNGDFGVWGAGTSAAPTGWTLSGAGAAAAQNTTTAQYHSGFNGVTLTSAAAPAVLSMDIASIPGQSKISDWQGKDVTLVGWIYTAAANVARIYVSDGVTETDGALHAGDSVLRMFVVRKRLALTANQVTCGLYIGAGVVSAVFSGVMLVVGRDIINLADFVPPKWQGRKAVMQFHSSSTGVAAGSTVYLSSSHDSTSEVSANTPIPFKKAVVRNMEAYASGAPTAAQTYTYTLRKGGVGGTALTCQTAGAVAIASSDITHEVYLAQGDVITPQLVTSAGAAATIHSVTLEIEEVPLA